MTENEKAKAYDEALKKASAAHKDEDRYLKATLERIFPELKEDDNERIRKNCIHFLELQKQYHAATFEIEECIDWLKKQGKQKPTIEMKSAEESLGISSEEYNKIIDKLIYDEQKHTDKVEPKFKVGDRIRHKITNKDVVYEITKVYDDSYGIAGFNWMIYMKYQDQYELVPNKFDPKTLKPYEKVLARNFTVSIWQCGIFSHQHFHQYFVYNDTYKFCIPYNDETKHLVGTTDEAPKYYRYWED